MKVSDILTVAIRLEEEGERFYRELSEYFDGEIKRLSLSLLIRKGLTRKSLERYQIRKTGMRWILISRDTLSMKFFLTRVKF